MALCLVLLSLPYGCADSLIIQTNHETIDPGGATRRVVRVDGRVVECWVTRSAGAMGTEPRAFVLFFVGKGDRADRWIVAVAGAWKNWPVELWGMNYPGSGGSEGPPRLAQLGPDALGVFDEMKRVAGDRPIFIQAGSLGTVPALCVAARRPVAGMVLQNPVPLRQLILGRYGWWNLWLVALPASMQLPADLNSTANAAHSRAPAIFISAGADRVIPPHYHRLVIDAYAGPKKIVPVPGANHNDPLPREAAQELARDLDWLWHSARPESIP